MRCRAVSLMLASFGPTMLLALPAFSWAKDAPADKLPSPGTIVVDQTRRELVLSAQVQFPEDKPCINEFGQRVQAFAGCATAAGGDAKMAGYFLFLVDVDTEKVFDGLVDLGCRPRVH